MMAALVGHGARVSGQVEGAEVVIVNTCGFIDAAKEEQSVETILEACALKAAGRREGGGGGGMPGAALQGRARRRDPRGGPLHGAHRDAGARARAPPGAFSPRRPARSRTWSAPSGSSPPTPPTPPSSRFREGCDHTCAFCAIPHMRGLHRSAPLEALVGRPANWRPGGCGSSTSSPRTPPGTAATCGAWRCRRRGQGGTPETTPLLPRTCSRPCSQIPTSPGTGSSTCIPRESRPSWWSSWPSPGILPYLDMPIQHGSDPCSEADAAPGAAGHHPGAGGVAPGRHSRPHPPHHRHRGVPRRDRGRVRGDARAPRGDPLRAGGGLPYSVEEGTPAARWRTRSRRREAGPPGAPHGSPARDLLRANRGPGGAARDRPGGPPARRRPGARGRGPHPGPGAGRGRAHADPPLARARAWSSWRCEIVDALEYDLVAWGREPRPVAARARAGPGVEFGGSGRYDPVPSPSSSTPEPMSEREPLNAPAPRRSPQTRPPRNGRFPGPLGPCAAGAPRRGELARPVLPLGGGTPFFVERGEGPFLFDTRGRRYVDYVLSWGPLVLGHAHPRIVEALEAQLSKGTSYGAPTAAEVEMAERLVRLVPSLDMVRLVNSGTEATMSALRVARGFTGRDRFLKFTGLLPRARRSLPGGRRVGGRHAGPSRFPRGSARPPPATPWSSPSTTPAGPRPLRPRG
jgi:hypothetical protein